MFTEPTFDLPKPATGLGAVVVIPARNEERRILHTLRSLDEQMVDPATVEVIVFANHCQDGTAEIARGFGQTSALPLHVLECDLPARLAHVGTARKLLWDMASLRLSDNKEQGLIFSTELNGREADGAAGQPRLLRIVVVAADYHFPRHFNRLEIDAVTFGSLHSQWFPPRRIDRGLDLVEFQKHHEPLAAFGASGDQRPCACSIPKPNSRKRSVWCSRRRMPWARP